MSVNIYSKSYTCSLHALATANTGRLVVDTTVPGATLKNFGGIKIAGIGAGHMIGAFSYFDLTDSALFTKLRTFRGQLACQSKNDIPSKIEQKALDNATTLLAKLTLTKKTHKDYLPHSNFQTLEQKENIIALAAISGIPVIKRPAPQPAEINDGYDSSSDESDAPTPPPRHHRK